MCSSPGFCSDDGVVEVIDYMPVGVKRARRAFDNWSGGLRPSAARSRFEWNVIRPLITRATPIRSSFPATGPSSVRQT